MATSIPRGGDAAVAQSATPRRCPLTAALTAVGGRWNLICLYWLNLGPRRFNELQRLMPEISHKVLSETLRNLEHEGLIVRLQCNEPLRRAEYRISAHGHSAAPLIEAVRHWGHQHIAWQAESPTQRASNHPDERQHASSEPPFGA